MPMPEYSVNHTWVIATNYKVTDKQARHAVLRHSLRIPKGDRLDVLETYCSQCRRPWDDVVGEPCEAASSNEHLRGGPIGTRKKRNHASHRCDLLGCDLSDDSPLDATG